MPRMTDAAVFSETAAEVARQAVADGVARRMLSPGTVLEKARKDIAEAHQALEMLMASGLIPPPPEAMIQRCLDAAIAAVGT